MIAEIHGKISSTGSNLSDRSEDQLTGDVFGTLRYIDDHIGLIPFLESSYFLTPCGRRESLKFQHGIMKQVRFWPWIVEAEPDLCIEITEGDDKESVVCIEAKYCSAVQSPHQLLRQMRGMQARYRGFRQVQIFLTTDQVYPQGLLSRVWQQAQAEGLQATELYWLSWHDLPAVLEQSLGHQSGGLSKQGERIIADLLMLCERKGFARFSQLQVPNDAPPRSFSLVVEAPCQCTPMPVVDRLPIVPKSMPTPIL